MNVNNEKETTVSGESAFTPKVELPPEVSYQYWSSKTEGDTVLLATFHGALGLRNVMVIEQG